MLENSNICQLLYITNSFLRRNKMLYIKKEIYQMERNQLALKIKYIDLLKHYKKLINAIDALYNEYEDVRMKNYELYQEIKEYKCSLEGNKKQLKQNKKCYEGQNKKLFNDMSSTQVEFYKGSKNGRRLFKKYFQTQRQN